jgi:YbbR domain-containing protein
VWKRLKRYLSGKEFIRLLFCVGLAALFWLLTKLSLTYAYDLDIKVTFHGLPQEKVLVNPLPDRLGVTVEATGWQLLRYGIQFNKPVVHLNFPDRVAGNFIPNNHRSEIAAQLPFEWNIIQVRPSDITLELQDRLTVQRPVKLVTDISVNPQFGLVDSVRYDPAMVEVTGPQGVVDTIRYVPTKPIHQEDLEQTVESSIALDTPPTPSVQYTPGTIHYTIPVEAFTETTTVVPIHLPKEQELNAVLIQKNTTLYLQLPVSRFEQMQSAEIGQLFRVVADFSGVTAQDSMVPLRLVQAPKYVRNTTLRPDRVKFLYLNND